MKFVPVKIHASQFPENVRRDLLASLRRRRLNHKFHYDSYKQSQKWLALHEAHSPARRDADCLDMYESAFRATARKLKTAQVHVIGLGCGGGQKDARLLKQLKKAGKKITYTPADVSVALTLVAHKAAAKIIPGAAGFPFVCDLSTADDLSGQLVTHHPSLVTFFGMIPNFEPGDILPKLAALLRRKDSLLFSANLAPGADYAAGVEKILPQYDNPLTRDWLMTLLLDLGIERKDGRLVFDIESGDLRLKRVMARFHFSRTREIMVQGERFKFRRGESIQVFFSYRYTSDRVAKALARHGLQVQAQWLAPSGEEGVFLCQRI